MSVAKSALWTFVQANKIGNCVPFVTLHAPVVVRGTHYRSGPSDIHSVDCDSVQPLIVYNIDDAAPEEENVPAEYTYARTARNRRRLPTPPFPVAPPQVSM